jgi:hypothetical protein
MNPIPPILAFMRREVERGATLEQAAQRAKRVSPRLYLDAIDALGSWPSSEPELRALQQAR